MRFGIGMNTDHTLEEVVLLGDARAHPLQIEAKALRKLKHPSRRETQKFPRQLIDTIHKRHAPGPKPGGCC